MMKHCEYVYRGKSCTRILYDEKHCIFHSRQIDLKTSSFYDFFWKEFERQKAYDENFNFAGFIFPVYFQFNQISFSKSVVFDGALFPGLIDFSGCQFLGPQSSFDGTKFLGLTSFLSTSFLGDSVSFRGACFINNSTSFYSTKFTTKNICFNWMFLLENPKNEYIEIDIPLFTEWKAYCHDDASYVNQILRGCSKLGISFDHADFVGVADFSDSHINTKQLSFNSTVFSSALYFIDARIVLDSFFMNTAKILKDVDFTFTQLSVQNLDLSNSIFKGKVIFDFGKLFFHKINLFNSNFSNVFGFEKFVEKTKFIKKVRYKFEDFRFSLGPESATRYPILDRKTRDAWFLSEFKTQHPIIYKLWNLSSKCGQSIFRWSLLSLFIILIFSFIYGKVGPAGFKMNHKSWFSYIYYSVVTFTTLGFGDITPKLWYSEMLVTIEVILGYIMLGGLISIFSNKLARRS